LWQFCRRRTGGSGIVAIAGLRIGGGRNRHRRWAEPRPAAARDGCWGAGGARRLGLVGDRAVQKVRSSPGWLCAPPSVAVSSPRCSWRS
jgi:hypothetical protein